MFILLEFESMEIGLFWSEADLEEMKCDFKNALQLFVATI